MSTEAGLNAWGKHRRCQACETGVLAKCLRNLNGCRSPLWSSSAGVSRLLESGGLPGLGPLWSSIAGVSRPLHENILLAAGPLWSSSAGVSR